MADMDKVRPSRVSQDQLVAGTGKVPVTLEGSDFEFVSKVAIEKVGDKFATPTAVPFVLAQGVRQGIQDKMDIQINTNDLNAGTYKLSITQAEHRVDSVEIKILPEPPKIENLPFTLHQGTTSGSFVLRGERLNLIEKIEIAKANVELEAPKSDQTEREVNFKMAPDIAAGTSIAARIYVLDRYRPISVPDAIRVGDPQPRLIDATVSRAAEQPVELHEGELPGGAFLSAMLNVENLQQNSAVRLGCKQPNTTTVTLQLGQQYGAVSLQQVSPGQLYLSFDTGVWFNRCRLQARIVNSNDAESESLDLGVIIRVPSIDYLDFSNEGMTTITGQNLETIEKVGWTPDVGEAVTELPLPFSGDSKRQTLKVNLPSPSEKDSRLYIWLRGEKTPRVTKVRT